jgi:hypothetical protein
MEFKNRFAGGRSLAVNLDVKNAGQRAGGEVAPLCVNHEPSALDQRVFPGRPCR